MDLLPVFFKIYFPDDSSEIMKMPEEFVGHLKADYKGCRQAYLVGPGGEEWRVGFARCGNDCFFTDGWKTFVKDNGVAYGHFLLFRYRGGMRFKVNIFTPSGLESEAAFTAKCTQGWKNNGAEKGQSSNNGGQVLPACCLVKPSADEGTSRRPGKRPKGESHMMSAAEQRVADVFSSVHPFIIRQMNFERSQMPVLHILKSFFSENSVICKPSDRHLVLRTRHGGCWSLTINHGTYVHTLCDGWASFLRDNNVENGDVCVFEIADSSKLELLVHVFHSPF
uniref:TF-B3 domain-containing protein n=1 Tax=Kalanchoe fedtschenkoi TaxID=63787 RepID=A0A7N0ZTJ0_KALFE